MTTKKKAHRKKPLKQNRFLFAGIVFLVFAFSASAQNADISLSVHLHGVSESKIALIPLSGSTQFKAIADVSGIKIGETATMEVSKEYLPGEFIIRFESKEKKESEPKPSEKRILINQQNLELWINPVHASNQDSCRFQKDERENTGFTFGCLLLGGMILGPVVQLYAFGDLWTGIPFGWDLTDNKTLIAFLFWIAAVIMNRRKERPVYTIIAAVLLLLIYSIPHSMFGSQLDYNTGNVTQGMIMNLFVF